MEKLPPTRFQGSKRKLLSKLRPIFQDLSFTSVLDAFGGTGSVTHLLRSLQKQCHYNDILPSNATIARALFNSSGMKLERAQIRSLFKRKRANRYPDTISRLYKDIYYTDQENRELDTFAVNVRELSPPARDEAYYCLFQAALAKRPFNLFHRANLNLRLRTVERSFGNKVSWDRPFLEHCGRFYEQLNCYRNHQPVTPVTVTSTDAFKIEGDFDLVYIDTPYTKSADKEGTNYFNYYHFLDGILSYEELERRATNLYRHRPFYSPNTPWHQESGLQEAFEKLFYHFRRATLAVSYRSDGYPSPEKLRAMLRRHYRTVSLVSLGNHSYALAKRRGQEVVLIAEGGS